MKTVDLIHKNALEECFNQKIWAFVGKRNTLNNDMISQILEIAFKNCVKENSGLSISKNDLERFRKKIDDIIKNHDLSIATRAAPAENRSGKPFSFNHRKSHKSRGKNRRQKSQRLRRKSAKSRKSRRKSRVTRASKSKYPTLRQQMRANPWMGEILRKKANKEKLSNYEKFLLNTMNQQPVGRSKRKSSRKKISRQSRMNKTKRKSFKKPVVKLSRKVADIGSKNSP